MNRHVYICLCTPMCTTHMLIHTCSESNKCCDSCPTSPICIRTCQCMIVHAGHVMSLLLHPVHLHAPPLYSTVPLLLHPCLVLCCLMCVITLLRLHVWFRYKLSLLCPAICMVTWCRTATMPCTRLQQVGSWI